MSYKDYLRSRHWKDKRREFIDENVRGKKCAICSSKRKLHVHHRRYKYLNGKSVLKNERKSCLVVFCNSCHSSWHGRHKDRPTGAVDISNARFLYELGASRSKAIQFCIYSKVIKNIKSLHRKGTDIRINKYIT